MCVPFIFLVVSQTEYKKAKFYKYYILSISSKVKHFYTCSFKVEDKRHGSLMGYDQKSTFKSSTKRHVLL